MNDPSSEMKHCEQSQADRPQTEQRQDHRSRYTPTSFSHHPHIHPKAECGHGHHRQQRRNVTDRCDSDGWNQAQRTAGDQGEEAEEGGVELLPIATMTILPPPWSTCPASSPLAAVGDATNDANVVPTGTVARLRRTRDPRPFRREPEGLVPRLYPGVVG